MSLVESVVLGRSKAKSLDAVHHLNVWGCKLTDIDIVSSLHNLEILNLSCNNLRDLRPLAACTNLKELYIRRNNLATAEDLKCLSNLENLKVIWLSGNPLCNEPGYREEVSKMLPQVMMLDNKTLKREPVMQDDDAVLQAVLLLLGQLDQTKLRTVQEKLNTLLT